MAAGSAGYTPTFSGDLTLSALKKARDVWSSLAKRLKKKRRAKKISRLKKLKSQPLAKVSPKNPAQVAKEKEEIKDIVKEEVEQEKVDKVEVQEVKKEEETKALEAGPERKLLGESKPSKPGSIVPASSIFSRKPVLPSAGQTGVVPVDVVDVTPQQRSLSEGQRSLPTGKKGGAIVPINRPAPLALPPAGESSASQVQRTTSLIRSNNDALINAIQGEIQQVEVAVIDVAAETVETRRMLGGILDEEKKQTPRFEKYAALLGESLKFKKKTAEKQKIYLKQKESDKIKDATGAAAIVKGGSGGSGGGFNIPGLPLSLAPLAALGALAKAFRNIGKGLRNLVGRGSAAGRNLAPRTRSFLGRTRDYLGRQFNRGRNFLSRQFGNGTRAFSRFNNLIQRRMYGLNQYTRPIGPMPLDSGPRGVGNWAKAGAGEVGDVFGNVPRAESSVQAGTPRRPTPKPPAKPPILTKLKSKAGGIVDKIFDLIPGLRGLQNKLKGLTLKKAVKFLNEKVVGTINGIKKGGNAAAKLALRVGGPIINPFVKGLGFLNKMVAAPAKFLKNALSPVLKVGKGLARVLGPILDIGFFALDTKSRLDSGFSPARAILPLIPRTLLTMGGAALGGTIGAAGGPLAAVGAMGGGFLGSLLGDQVVKFIDGSWNKSWDSGIFKDFNEGAYGLLADKLGYNPPRSEQEALDRDIEAEAAAKGHDPREYQGYSGAYDSASMQADRPDRSTGGFATRLGDAASKFIYSKFGMRKGKMHKGLDISGGPYVNGAPLSSLLGGRVAMAEDLGRSGWGKYVVLNHANGTSSLYGHLSKYFVQTGDTVEPGEIIGNIGSTGSSSGPHLHFELGSRWNGGTLDGHVDPKGYIDQYVSVAGSVGSMGDAVSFNVPEGTASQNASALINGSEAAGIGGPMMVAVQLPPVDNPVIADQQESGSAPGLKPVRHPYWYAQNAEALALV